MSEAPSIPLGNSLVTSVVEYVNYGTGVISYTVKRKLLPGSVTLCPRYSNDTEITPSRVIVEPVAAQAKTNGKIFSLPTVSKLTAGNP